jgi:hypothetical protein
MSSILVNFLAPKCPSNFSDSLSKKILLVNFLIVQNFESLELLKVNINEYSREVRE